MSFSIIIFVAVLWTLSSEMIEDVFVNLIYGHMFGWKNLTSALLASAAFLSAVSAILITYASGFLTENLGLISKLAAILLGVIGTFWLVSSTLRREVEGVEEARKMRADKKGNGRSFLTVLQLVSIEELEVLLVVIPLIVASHALEASFAAAVGILVSVSTAAWLRKSFEKFVSGKFRLLKIVSGLFLISLAAILFLEL